jgi:hypothetical protein
MSGILPNWIERWLGVEPGSPGQGTEWVLEYTWPLPPWLTLLAVAAAVALVALAYSREATTAGRALRTTLMALRLAVLTMVVFMVAEVTLSLRRTGLPSVAVLLDDSASMAIEDRYSDKKIETAVQRRLDAAGLSPASRFNLARSILRENGTDLLAAVERRYRLK